MQLAPLQEVAAVAVRNKPSFPPLDYHVVQARAPTRRFPTNSTSLDHSGLCYSEEQITTTGRQLRIIAVTALILSLSFVGVRDLLAQRSGFIIGFGIGPGVNILSDEGESESEVGVATDFKIGAQVNESIQLYYLNRVVFFFPDGLDFALGGMAGVGVTYVLPSSPKIHLSGGIGVSTLAVFFDGDSDSTNGFGLTAGFGYEFADLWLFDIGVAYGRPSESGESVNMFDIRAGISILSH